MIIDIHDYLAHYGTPRRSGRYPWGSGKDPYQGHAGFLAAISEHKKSGMSDVEIARAYGMTTTQLRAAKSIARNEKRAADISRAQKLKDRGWSTTAIGREMGVNESSVRSMLAPGALEKVKKLDATSNLLRDEISKKGLIDIGAGSVHQTNVSQTQFDNAIAKLRHEGYKVHYVKVRQLGTGKDTTIKVLSAPDVPYSEVYKNRFNIKQIDGFVDPDSPTGIGIIKPPTSVKSNRVEVVYAEDGGSDADGVIYIRPGVSDLDMGKSRYAQVRIAVDDSHYIKGMAVYKDDLPEGVDILFNTSKSRSEAPTKLDALKPFETDIHGKVDAQNPFKSSIRRQSGALNIINEEGTWDTWSKKLSSQFLSKQNPKLAREQLNMTFEQKTSELNDILELTNPSVRRRLLQTFSDSVDSSAVHLKAAALPRQSNSVILPIKSMRETEVYAPNYNNGDRVVLIRHPHAGTFEIPELIVNNRNRSAKAIMGKNPPDAIGIHPKVAERLSGADFDGDTVLVIRNNHGRVKSTPALQELKNFDPRRSYPGYEGMKPLDPRSKQQQMGDISNLITDMTIKGASPSELARAVRHSMVVIDAEKHKLNYKLSAQENGIASLKEKYQKGRRKGAATLISRAGSEIRVPERKQTIRIDPETGKKQYFETGATYTDPKTGQIKQRTTTVKRLADTDDAHTLSSGTRIERIYADHSNRLKGLANAARKEMVNTKSTPYSPSARAAYQKEVDSLVSKLRVAESNAPRERQAQLVANSIYRTKLDANPGMDDDDKKKIRNQALAEARVRTGASKTQIDITPSEWEAIQAGAISPTRLDNILNHTDVEVVKKYATPRTRPAISSAKIARARGMAAAGYTQAEIAQALGVSVTAVSGIINREGG